MGGFDGPPRESTGACSCAMDFVDYQRLWVGVLRETVAVTSSLTTPTALRLGSAGVAGAATVVSLTCCCSLVQVMMIPNPVTPWLKTSWWVPRGDRGTGRELPGLVGGGEK